MEKGFVNFASENLFQLGITKNFALMNVICKITTQKESRYSA